MLLQYEMYDLDMMLSPNEMGFSYPMPAATTYPPFIQHHYAMLSRGPQPYLDIGNLLRPFPAIVWALVGLSILVAVCYFQLAFVVYSSLPLGHELLAESVESGDIALRTISTLTEPERFNYFRAWSAGKQNI